jgi:hypothetical protein
MFYVSNAISSHKGNGNNTLILKLRGLLSASELYRPSGRRLSAKLVPTLADRGCCVVNATDPRGHETDIYLFDNKFVYYRLKNIVRCWFRLYDHLGRRISNYNIITNILCKCTNKNIYITTSLVSNLNRILVI